MEDNKFLLDYIKNTSKIVNQSINLYTFALIKNIFCIPSKSEKATKIEKKLIAMTNKINNRIIKNQDKYIDVETEDKYSIKNFNNIICFINNQNKKYTGEILEGILILLFSKAFKTEKNNTFGKYIFNNVSKLKDSTNFELAKWLEKTPKFFKNKELHSVRELLSLDASIDDMNKDSPETNYFQENSPFFNLLTEIFKYKYINLAKQYKNNKTIYYINKGIFDSQEMGNKIYEDLKDSSKTTFERDLSSNSICKFISCLYFSGEFGKIRSVPINMMRAFFISVFIYYQNKNSPLMKYIEPYKAKTDEKKDEINDGKIDNKNDLAIIPFMFNLKGACVEGRFTNIIHSPLRIEPRISQISLCQNNLRETGLFEMAKTLVFNKNINMIEYSKSLLKSYFLDYFNFGLGLYDNFTLEDLNISSNYIREDCGEFFAKFLSHLKGLKTLNLSANDFKSGISNFFVILKKLYRKKKINLEILYLNKCLLDDTSLYELGELLKCKYCKLKRVYLSSNNKPNCFNLLKKIKKNKSLVEINFNKNNYSNDDVDDFNRIINTTNINHLNISKNRITNFNQCIRIAYRTKLINDKKDIITENKNDNKIEESNSQEQSNMDRDEKEANINQQNNQNIIIGNSGMLFNLDLSNNEGWGINDKEINLIYKIINETTLSCLDLSHILYGPNPDKIDKEKIKESYKNAIEKIKKLLEQNKNKYKIIYGDKISKTVDIKHYENLEKEELIQKINEKFDDDINEKINDNLAQFPVFLKEAAIEIMNKIKQNENCSDIRDMLNTNSNKDSKDKEFLIKLEQYMTLKKAQKDLADINQKLDDKKLIII